MKKSCFVVPIHQPKFKFAIPLVISYNNYFNDGDLFFIFSDESEKNLFDTGLNNKDVKYKSIIFTGNEQHWIVTQKKWFGIEYIFNNYNYNYVGVIDAESIFFRYLDYHNIFQTKDIKNNILCSNANDIFFPFTYMELLKIFKKEDQDKIKKNIFIDEKGKNNSIGNNSKQNYYEILKIDPQLWNKPITKNFWFNDIPVYERNKFLNFIKYLKINTIDGTLNNLKDIGIKKHPLLSNELMGGNPLNFDYIVYIYYLICTDQCKLKEIPYENDNFLDQIPGSFTEKQLYMCPKKFMEAYNFTDSMFIYKKINNSYMKNTFVEFHTDRNLQSELTRIKNDAWMLRSETLRNNTYYYDWLEYYKEENK